MKSGFRASSQMKISANCLRSALGVKENKFHEHPAVPAVFYVEVGNKMEKSTFLRFRQKS